VEFPLLGKGKKGGDPLGPSKKRGGSLFFPEGKAFLTVEGGRKGGKRGKTKESDLLECAPSTVRGRQENSLWEEGVKCRPREGSGNILLPSERGILLHHLRSIPL